MGGSQKQYIKELQLVQDKRCVWVGFDLLTRPPGKLWDTGLAFNK